MPVVRGGGASGAGGGALSNGSVIQYGGVRGPPLSNPASRIVLLADGAGPVAGGAFLPSSITGLQAWYDADALAGADGSNISTFTDQQGSFNATLSSGTGPVLRYATLNGRKVAEFIGSNSAKMDISSSLLNGATAGTFYAVVKLKNDPPIFGTNAGAILENFGSDAASAHHPYTDGNIYDDFGMAARQTYSATRPSLSSTYRIVCIEAGSSTQKLYIDGVLIDTKGSVTINFGTGTRRMGHNGSMYLDGYIAEILPYNAVQVQADREKLEGYLAHKWGIQANLDAGHPYKSAPPGGAGAYSLTAAAGSFALAGGAATFPVARWLTAAAGAFTLVGAAVNLKRGLKLTAAPGAYALSGGAASFLMARKLVAAAGAFALTGGAATFKRGIRLQAAAGSFALNGGGATLRRTYRMVSAAGAYSFGGGAATLSKTSASTMVAASGAFALSGGAATLKAGRRLIAGAGAYALAGGAASLTKLGLNNYTLVATPAAYALAGGAAGFTLTANMWFVRNPAPAAGAFLTTSDPNEVALVPDTPPPAAVLDTVAQPPSPAFVRAVPPVAAELG